MNNHIIVTMTKYHIKTTTSFHTGPLFLIAIIDHLYFSLLKYGIINSGRIFDLNLKQR